MEPLWMQANHWKSQQGRKDLGPAWYFLVLRMDGDSSASWPSLHCWAPGQNLSPRAFFNYKIINSICSPHFSRGAQCSCVDYKSVERYSWDPREVGKVTLGWEVSFRESSSSPSLLSDLLQTTGSAQAWPYLPSVSGVNISFGSSVLPN